jgi:hypothetical protein
MYIFKIQETSFFIHSRLENVVFHCNWSSESHPLLQLSSSLNATLSSSVFQDHFKEIFNKTQLKIYESWNVT